jgi:hypothetical protein
MRPFKPLYQSPSPFRLRSRSIVLKLRHNQERIQEVERELVAFRRFHGAHQRVQEARCAAAGARRR